MNSATHLFSQRKGFFAGSRYSLQKLVRRHVALECSWIVDLVQQLAQDVDQHVIDATGVFATEKKIAEWRHAVQHLRNADK